MLHIKLQLGCLIVTLYIIAMYIRDTRKSKVSRNKLFEALLFLCPSFILFDGITAWSVNNMDIVPLWLNYVFHICFYVSVLLVIVVSFFYMCDVTVGLPKKKSQIIGLLVPCILSLIITFAFLPEVKYLHGKITNYSMGISVVACYSSVILYFGLILFVCIFHKSKIEKRKYRSVVIFVFISFGIALVQIFYNEVLLTAIVPMMLLLGMYMNMEDPSYKRLLRYNEEMISGFATLVENRDDNTGGHIKRTKCYVEIILNAMKQKPEYRKITTKDYLYNVANAAPMHDLGKISTPDYILQKPGKLTDEEFEVMKKHAAKGGEIILDTFGGINDKEFLDIAYNVARYHHEKWDGTGYPDKLKGEDIPLCARIMAIADVFDAVSAPRCYRPALPLETCFKIIEDGVGKHFDPALAKLFLEQRDKVTEVYNSEMKQNK